jgi:hypothetical protein
VQYSKISKKCRLSPSNTNLHTALLIILRTRLLGILTTAPLQALVAPTDSDDDQVFQVNNYKVLMWMYVGSTRDLLRPWVHATSNNLQHVD